MNQKRFQFIPIMVVSIFALLFTILLFLLQIGEANPSLCAVAFDTSSPNLSLCQDGLHANPPKVLPKVLHLHFLLSIWTASVLGLLSALIWNLGLSLTLIKESALCPFLDSMGTKEWAAFIILLIVATFIVVGVMSFLPDFAGAAGSVLEPLKSLGGYVTAIAVIRMANGFAVIVTLSVVVAIVGLCRPLPVGDTNALRNRVLDLRWSLYSAAGLLVFGLIEVYCAYKLGTMAHPHPDKELKTIGHGIIAGAGFLFTSLLLVLYLPAVFIQKYFLEGLWATHLAAIAANSLAPNRKSWLEETGLDDSSGKSLSELGALAAPTIAGVILSFLGTR